MHHRKQVLFSFCVLLCVGAVYVPPVVAGCAIAISIEAVSNGQTNLGQSAALVAVICGILWISPVPAWYLARKLRRHRVDHRSANRQKQHKQPRLRSWVQRTLARPGGPRRR